MNGGEGYGVMGLPQLGAAGEVDILQSPGEQLLSGLSPVGRVPIEAIKGEQLGTGAPIEQNLTGKTNPSGSHTPGLPEFIAEQSGYWPIAKPLQMATSKSGMDNAFLNFFTGANKVDSGEYANQANYDAEQRLLEQARKGNG